MQTQLGPETLYHQFTAQTRVGAFLPFSELPLATRQAWAELSNYVLNVVEAKRGEL